MKLSDLADALANLKTLVMGKPSFEWGTIESVSPLLVSTDSDTTLVAGAGSTVPLVPGARVRLERQGPRLTVMGVAGGAPSGRITLTDVPITTASGSIYRSEAIPVPIGVTPPPGWSWNLTVHLSTNGAWGKSRNNTTTDTPNIQLHCSVSTTAGTVYVQYQLSRITSI